MSGCPICSAPRQLRRGPRVDQRPSVARCRSRPAQTAPREPRPRRGAHVRSRHPPGLLARRVRARGAALLVDQRRFPSIAHIVAVLGVPARSPRCPSRTTAPTASGEAYYGRPEAFLDPAVRASQLGWAADRPPRDRARPRATAPRSRLRRMGRPSRSRPLVGSGAGRDLEGAFQVRRTRTGLRVRVRSTQRPSLLSISTGMPQTPQSDRRTFIKQGLIAAGGLALGAAGGTSAAARLGHAPQHAAHRRAKHARAAPPNILVILVDQLRTPVWMPLGASPATLMPNLAALRNGAVNFERHYTAANDCSPSRGTLSRASTPTRPAA
jgi:hypothetical protein